MNLSAVKGAPTPSSMYPSTSLLYIYKGGEVQHRHKYLELCHSHVNKALSTRSRLPQW